MRKYLCLANDEHTLETEEELRAADNGICPFCGAQITWEDYEE